LVIFSQLCSNWAGSAAFQLQARPYGFCEDFSLGSSSHSDHLRWVPSDEYRPPDPANDWGVERKLWPPPSTSSLLSSTPTSFAPRFPHTVQQVTDAAWEAITAVWEEQEDESFHLNRRILSYPDPNIVRNAMYSGDHYSVHGRRPVRTIRDKGRIGVEIDGAACLFDDGKQLGSSRISETRAIRLLSMILAGKLSQKDFFPGCTNAPASPLRRVAVFVNTVRQALAASHELRYLKSVYSENNEKSLMPFFDQISIHCLGLDDDLDRILKSDHASVETLPSDDTPARQQKIDPPAESQPQRKRSSRGETDPDCGVLLIVQPTDYNNEYRPPGPALNSIDSFQLLATQATVRNVPVIVVSPRFLVNFDDESADIDDEYIRRSNGSHRQAQSISSRPGGWDQSVYQRSAAYGGYEPPRGPTPWILRDFHPPAFSWIGTAVRLIPSRAVQRVHHGTTAGKAVNRNDEMLAARKAAIHVTDQQALTVSLDTRICLLQSVTLQGHSWNIYAARESFQNINEVRCFREGVAYWYVASTRNSAGRPTRDLMQGLHFDFTDG
jgi:hypothetical protein